MVIFCRSEAQFGNLYNCYDNSKIKKSATCFLTIFWVATLKVILQIIFAHRMLFVL